MPNIELYGVLKEAEPGKSYPVPVTSDCPPPWRRVAEYALT